MKPVTGLLLVIIALLIVGGAAMFPPWQAERRYEAAGQSDREQCDAAQEAAIAWARFGFEGKADHWRDKAGFPCALADFRQSLM